MRLTSRVRMGLRRLYDPFALLVAGHARHVHLGQCAAPRGGGAGGQLGFGDRQAQPPVVRPCRVAFQILRLNSYATVKRRLHG